MKRSCDTCKHYGRPVGFEERRGYSTAHPCLYPMPVVPKLPDSVRNRRFITIEKNLLMFKDEGITCECFE